MPVHVDQTAGTVRSATPTDAPALSRLLASIGADVMPVTAGDVAVLLERGHLLVLDLGADTLGAAAHFVLDHTGPDRRAVFRYLAVHPALAPSDVEQRMTAAMVGVCDGVDAIGIQAALAASEPVHALRFERARRMVYLMLFLLAMPRVLASAGHNAAAVVMFVWSALALLSPVRIPRIPRAIALRRRAARLRAWSDAVLLRIGELPLATYGRHAIAPPWQLPAEAPVTPPGPA